MIGILTTIGDSYEKLNQLKLAFSYNYTAKQFAHGLKNEDYNGIIFNNLGNSFAKQYHKSALKADIDSSVSNYQQAYAYYQKANDQDGICESTLGLAALYQITGVVDSILKYANISYNTAMSGKFRVRILNASRLLYTFFKKRGDRSKTLYYLELADKLNTDLYQQDKVSAIANQFDDEQKREYALKQELERQEKANRDNLQMIVIAFVILVFGLIVFFYSRRKVKPQTVHFLVFFGLLMIFEFIGLLLHPKIEAITHLTDDIPFVTLLVLMVEAAVLGPLHQWAENWAYQKLVRTNPKE